MGWGHCGTDELGREIGYCIPARCDEPGCNKKIDRGLAYACGGMHGDDEGGCLGYFCGAHMFMVDRRKHDLRMGQLCIRCLEAYEKGVEPDPVGFGPPRRSAQEEIRRLLGLARVSIADAAASIRRMNAAWTGSNDPENDFIVPSRVFQKRVKTNHARRD